KEPLQCAISNQRHTGGAFTVLHKGDPSVSGWLIEQWSKVLGVAVAPHNAAHTSGFPGSADHTLCSKLLGRYRGWAIPFPHHIEASEILDLGRDPAREAVHSGYAEGDY